MLSAYYSGALTMFFTAPKGAPFQTIDHGLDLYPEWVPVLLAGDEIIFNVRRQEAKFKGT